ncbi:hypothetical protein [Trichothermofontia sp.]
MVTVTKNETLTALNKPEHFILALRRVPADQNCPMRLGPRRILAFRLYLERAVWCAPFRPLDSDL